MVFSLGWLNTCAIPRQPGQLEVMKLQFDKHPRNGGGPHDADGPVRAWTRFALSLHGSRSCMTDDLLAVILGCWFMSALSFVAEEVGRIPSSGRNDRFQWVDMELRHTFRFCELGSSLQLLTEGKTFLSLVKGLGLYVFRLCIIHDVFRHKLQGDY